MRRVATHSFYDPFLPFQPDLNLPGSIRANFCIIIFQTLSLTMNVRTLSLLIVVFASLSGFAQQPDTAFVSASISRAKQVYTTALKAEWPMNSGGQYVEYASIEGEHPY